MVRVTIQEVQERVFKAHHGVVSLDTSTYINTNTKACFDDSEYGRWLAKPYKVMAGQGHPKRGFKKISKHRMNTLEDVKKKIFLKHGNILSLKEATYIKGNVKAIFIDKEYGEWEAMPYVVIAGQGHPQRKSEKRRQTSLKRYGHKCCLQNKEIQEKTKRSNIKKFGCEHPSQNKEISLQIARTSNKITDLIHWKTGDIVSCQASYEVAVVNHLNINKIDYRWQPQVFKMANGKTYRPDGYLLIQDLWIEVKGYMRKDAQEKWDWFHKEYPNSELWDKNKLKQLGIL